KGSEATTVLQNAIKSNPSSVVARYSLGLAYAKEKNFSGAEAEWTEAVKTAGTFLLPHLSLAQLKLDQGDKETAAKFARQALVVIPTMGEAQLILALATNDPAEFKTASKLLEDAVKKNQTDASLRQRLGVAYIGQGA